MPPDTAPASSSRDLRSWLDLVERHGGLARIGAEVDPVEELSAITFLGSRQPGSPAFLFDKLTGDGMGARVLSNMLAASKERYALAVGLDPALPVRELVTETRRIGSRRIAPVEVAAAAAPVRETTLAGDDIDLTRFPAPKFWPGDGGRYLGTGNVTFIRNPDTGVVNGGVYRQMLHGPRRLGLNMVPGRHGAQNCEAWWKRGLPCPVVTTYGVDPAMFIAATQVYAHGESEIDAAGGLAGEPMQVTAADLSDLPLLARAEMVVEGFIHPDDVEREGPLGEFHGYYSGKTDLRAVIQVERVHYRHNPILTAALMATWPSCEIGEYHAVMRSARVWDNLDAMGVPGIAGVYVYPASASAAGLMVVSMKQLYAGHVAQVLALAAQCPAAAYVIRWIVAVDDDVDPTNIGEVMWAMSVHSNPADDIDILRKTWSYRTDPSLAPDARPYGSKALIDACLPHRYRATQSRRARLSRGTYERVAARWAELGLPGAAPSITHFHED
ncbi:Phenolic acid decarboxylase subunit C [Pigmentiphaga humi]|uniref:Phenolic acid decarboxylase subunit C n=1 Tax=Pigmentiphaga humi TaxID=2478468 RepID=A0A3P4B625_9BURK|nr:UbiD family decarboxylase [Pigmentiphaga humi]VCU71070.1 Phenolic acid decarboxylase subunit C [Pigmentiphaga humi]